MSDKLKDDVKLSKKQNEAYSIMAETFINKHSETLVFGISKSRSYLL